jgi:hypothetical protein
MGCNFLEAEIHDVIFRPSGCVKDPAGYRAKFSAVALLPNVQKLVFRGRITVRSPDLKIERAGNLRRWQIEMAVRFSHYPVNMLSIESETAAPLILKSVF